MQSQEIIMWFGYTQTAKSSSIKLLTGDQTIQCGRPGRGGSTTSEIKIYKEILPKLTKKYLHLDSIGLGDNTLKYNEESIREHIEKVILNFSSANNLNKISAIIITESLKDSSHQLRNIFAQITKIFGFLPVKSIIVLGTKQNAVNLYEQLQDREQSFRQIFEQFGVPESHYMRFDTPYIKFLQSQINPLQYNNLQQKLSSCLPITFQSIQQKHNKIRQRAVQIQIQKTITQQIQLQQDKILQKDEQKIRKRQVLKDKWKGLVGRVVGIKDYFLTQQQYVENIKVFEIIKENIIKEIQKTPEFQYCYKLALEEFQQKVVAQMYVKCQVIRLR